MTDYSLDFSHTSGKPEFRAVLRSTPEDFCVEEVLDFVPCGEGEHLYLHIRKCNQNTLWVARQLARFCGVKDMDVGYCGLKDRRAVTSQWFSVYRPKGPPLDWPGFVADGVELLSATRHTHKLKPGLHQANLFTIRLRECAGELGDMQAIGRGVPNYFGEQRFGIAARAYLFNQVLSARVARGNWQTRLSGDMGEFPTGPLWGRGRSPVGGATSELEQAVLAPWSHWCKGLEHVGLQQERRILVCRPHDFAVAWQDSDLRLTFGLGPGQYATTVLREVAQLTPIRAY
ncbi:MAG: tRNA pseudouridine(13) synthase TruD [Cellvibrionaceae bacterium]